MLSSYVKYLWPYKHFSKNLLLYIVQHNLSMTNTLV